MKDIGEQPEREQKKKSICGLLEYLQTQPAGSYVTGQIQRQQARKEILKGTRKNVYFRLPNLKNIDAGKREQK